MIARAIVYERDCLRARLLHCGCDGVNKEVSIILALNDVCAIVGM